MKRTLLVAFGLCVIGGVGYGQQLPHYTQYVLNTYIINPAVAGIENYTDVKISHRHQWMGIDGAPVTTYLTIHAPLKKSDYDRVTPTGFAPGNENPRGRAYWQDYEKADPHAGVGLTILNDRTGPLNRFAAYGTYAYHLGIGPRTSFAAGISAGIKNTTLNTSLLHFEDPRPDPAVYGSGYLNKMKPEVNLGVYMYSANYFLGLSAQNVAGGDLSFSGKTDTAILTKGKLVPHMFLTGGYRMFLTDDISFLPSALLKYVSGAPFSFDLNTKFQYRDFIWAGFSYRHEDSWAAMLGLSISPTVNISYAHDVTTSRLSTVSKGSHEFMVGFILNNKWGDWCPRNLW